MKRIFYSFICVFSLLLVCVTTCPDKSAHSEELMNLFNVAFQSELSNITTEENEGWVMLGSALGSGIAEYVINQHLVVDNYFVCSIGRTIYEGEKKIVSVGVLNHVFTMSEDELLKKLQRE